MKKLIAVNKEIKCEEDCTLALEVTPYTSLLLILDAGGILASCLEEKGRMAGP
jgi:hypothetical protein